MISNVFSTNRSAHLKFRTPFVLAREYSVQGTLAPITSKSPGEKTSQYLQVKISTHIFGSHEGRISSVVTWYPNSRSRLATEPVPVNKSKAFGKTRDFSREFFIMVQMGMGDLWTSFGGKGRHDPWHHVSLNKNQPPPALHSPPAPRQEGVKWVGYFTSKKVCPWPNVIALPMRGKTAMTQPPPVAVIIAPLCRI